MWHRLTDIDQEKRSAVCSVCGPTKIRQYGSGRWRCSRPANHGNGWRKFHEKYGFHPNSQQALLGLSDGDIEKMLNDQGGVCAICGGLPSHQLEKFCIDHATGCVRGLLCGYCNTALGHLRDNPAFAEAAAACLRKHQK